MYRYISICLCHRRFFMEAIKISEATEITNDCCGEAKDGICCIKVLGAGCSSCHTQYENAKEAVKNMGLDTRVEYITDIQKIMEYGVMSMPSML